MTCCASVCACDNHGLGFSLDAPAYRPSLLCAFWLRRGGARQPKAFEGLQDSTHPHARRQTTSRQSTATRCNPAMRTGAVPGAAQYRRYDQEQSSGAHSNTGTLRHRAQQQPRAQPLCCLKDAAVLRACVRLRAPAHSPQCIAGLTTTLLHQLHTWTHVSAQPPACKAVVDLGDGTSMFSTAALSSGRRHHDWPSKRDHGESSQPSCPVAVSCVRRCVIFPLCAPL